MSNEPDFLICVECESPLYTFEWDETGECLQEAMCLVCGNDNVEEFQTEEEYLGEE
jgi:hypothetical protein